MGWVMRALQERKYRCDVCGTEKNVLTDHTKNVGSYCGFCKYRTKHFHQDASGESVWRFSDEILPNLMGRRAS